MADQWFYSHDGIKVGPCSARQLRDVADLGGLLLTDTVWKQGITTGVLARQVKNLFPLPAPPPILAAAVAPPAILAAALAPPPVLPAPPPEAKAEPDTAPAAQAPALPADETTRPLAPAKHPEKVRQKRATSVVGAVIVSQDGVRAQYKKVCNKCGYEDATRHSMLIRQGRTRVAFHCRKCRKNRPVEIQGT